MIAIALLLALAVLLVLQERYYEKHSMEELSYRATLSAEEVFEGEDIYLYEILTNEKAMPLPALRAESELPQGLSFRLHGTKAEKGKDRLVPSVQSVFALWGNKRIKRRWRVSCGVRGEYRVGSVLLVATDLLGMTSVSRRITAEQGGSSVLTVLPKPIDLESMFVSSFYLSGDRVAPRALLTDPLLQAGTREYAPCDPMNRINWKSTAVHGKLMVNLEEYTRRERFTLVLNQQSRPIELHPHEPSDPVSVELGISVCATLLDRLSASQTPIRMLINAPSEGLADHGVIPLAMGQEQDGALLTMEYQGRQEALSALRLLAALPMAIAAPAEALWDSLLQSAPEIADGGNLVIVSSYLDERMLVLHSALAQKGYRVVFIITGTTQNTQIPEDVPVYFRTTKEGIR